MKHRLIGWVRYAKRFAASFYLLNKNSLLGRSFVSHPRLRLFVETTGFCNLECKFCSYPKNVRPRTSMSDEVFRRAIDQAAELGYRDIAVTPITGDVFMDKKFVDRLRYVEQSPIETIEFYTNFIAADETAIAALVAMPKLVTMFISVYGHDLDSFHRITGRGKAQYRRLIDNLATLERLWPAGRRGLRIVIGMRTYRSFKPGVTDGGKVVDAIHRLRRHGAEFAASSTVDNWGGDVTLADIADIDMTLTDGRYLYKKGPCGLLFDGTQVTADGRVNACACRDPHGVLTLGDIRTTDLADILSVGNEKWTRIIADQEAGRFNDVCASCGLYRSIHDERRTRDPGGADLMTKAEYFSLFTADRRSGADAGP